MVFCLLSPLTLLAEVPVVVPLELGRQVARIRPVSAALHQVRARTVEVDLIEQLLGGEGCSATV
jgi:hypothetical protein